jgi:hypothetical protein
MKSKPYWKKSIDSKHFTFEDIAKKVDEGFEVAMTVGTISGKPMHDAALCDEKKKISLYGIDFDLMNDFIRDGNVKFSHAKQHKIVSCRIKEYRYSKQGGGNPMNEVMMMLLP